MITIGFVGLAHTGGLLPESLKTGPRLTPLDCLMKAQLYFENLPLDSHEQHGFGIKFAPTVLPVEPGVRPADTVQARVRFDHPESLNSCTSRFETWR